MTTVRITNLKTNPFSIDVMFDKDRQLRKTIAAGSYIDTDIATWDEFNRNAEITALRSSTRTGGAAISLTKLRAGADLPGTSGYPNVIKDPVVCGSTANINLATVGLGTIDGIATTAGMRVLVKNQSTGSQNGIYEASASTWTRAPDADDVDDFTDGMIVPIQRGTTLANTNWQLTTTTPIAAVGTTSLSFSQMVSAVGAGTITATELGVTAGTVEANKAVVPTTNNVVDNLDVTALEVGAFNPRAATELTIATGAIAATQLVHTVDTEADAATDDLDTITGGSAEELLILRAASGARTVILRHAIGANNIATPGGVPIALQDASDYALLSHNGSQWTVVAFSSLMTATTLTIASGAVALVGGLPVHILDTEGAAATDDLDDVTGGIQGQVVRFRLAAAARNVVIRHAVGANKIATPDGRNITLDVLTDWVELVYNGTQWTVVASSQITDSSWDIVDPGNAGAIPVTRSGVCTLVSAGAETRTLAAPSFAGQRLLLFTGTAAGNIVITVATTVNATGNNTLTINAAEDFVDLQGILIGGNLRWRIVTNNSVALSTV